LAALGVALAAVLAIRALLPFALTWYVNRTLDGIEGYAGHVDDVDVALWRGAYRVEGVRLDRVADEEPEPLLRAHAIDLSLEWRALLDGALVGEVVLERPVYSVIAAPPAADQALEQSGLGVDWAERLDALFPFRLNRFEVRDGRLRYVDPHRSPKVDVELHDLRALGSNWGNVGEAPEGRYAKAWLAGRLPGDAEVVGSLAADPRASPPDFAAALRAERIDLRSLHEFLEAYLGADAESGTLSVFAEVDARDGRFRGYLKPLVRELDVLGDEEPGEGWLELAWEGFVGAIAEVLQNQPEEQQGARIPIEGSLEQPRGGVLPAVGSALWNAFVQALPSRLENPERLAQPG
jgi:hypothetical protein